MASGNANNGAAKKPLVASADGSPSGIPAAAANYRAFVITGAHAAKDFPATMRSLADPVYRSVQLAKTPAVAGPGQPGAAFVDTGAKMAGVASLPKSQMLKDAAAAKTNQTAQTEIAATAAKCVPRETLIAGFPFSPSCVIVDESACDDALRTVCKTLSGELKPHKGCVRAKVDNETKIKVCAYRDVKLPGKVVLEFLRLDGCAFVFQKAFVQSKLDLGRFIKDFNPEEAESELEFAKERLNMWYNPPVLSI